MLKNASVASIVNTFKRPVQKNTFYEKRNPNGIMKKGLAVKWSVSGICHVSYP